MSKTKETLMIISFCLVGFFSYANQQIVFPVVAAITDDLGVTNAAQISLISTISSIAIIPGILLGAALSQRWAKRNIIALACIIFAIGGAVMALAPNITVVLVGRAITGFGTGLGTLMVTGVIPDYVEKDRVAGVMGFVLAIAALYGVLQGMLAGALGQNLGWRAAMWLHMLAVLSLIMSLLFIPSKPLVHISEETHSSDTGKIDKRVFVFSLLGFIMWMSLMVVYSNVSIFITSEGIGNTAQAGIATGLITLGGFISSMFFGKIYGKLNVKTVLVYMSLAVLAFAAFTIAHNLPMAIAGGLLIGATVGLLPNTLLTSATMVSPERQETAQSIVLVGIYLGMFAATPWQSLVTRIVGSGLRQQYTFNIVFNFLVIVITAAILLISGKQKQT